MNLVLYLNELTKEFIPVVEHDFNLSFLHNMSNLEIVAHFPEEINRISNFDSQKYNSKNFLQAFFSPSLKDVNHTSRPKS